MGPFYTGQRPAEPLVITVRDAYGAAKDLTGYNTATLVLIDPAGNEVDLSGGSTTIANAEQGTVSFVWPQATVLENAGDYKYQIRLDGDTYADYTSVDRFEVYERLGE